jgi:hypothetical protein
LKLIADQPQEAKESSVCCLLEAIAFGLEAATLLSPWGMVYVSISVVIQIS